MTYKNVIIQGEDSYISLRCSFNFFDLSETGSTQHTPFSLSSSQAADIPLNFGAEVCDLCLSSIINASAKDYFSIFLRKERLSGIYGIQPQYPLSFLVLVKLSCHLSFVCNFIAWLTDSLCIPLYLISTHYPGNLYVLNGMFHPVVSHWLKSFTFNDFGSCQHV